MTVTPRYPADKYTYRVLWSDHRQYVGVCTEFPGLSYQAETHAAALDGIIARVRGELESKQEEGEELPVPMAIRRFDRRDR